MGRIAKILSFVRLTKNEAKVSDVKVNPGGGPNITAEHFADPGDDSHPLDSDYVALNSDSGTGRESAIGYLDPINEPKAQPGDKRIYGRDAESGEVVVEVWLKNDGTAVVSNDNGTFTLSSNGAISGSNGSGSFELQSGGDFLVNGVTIDISGNITTGGTIQGQGVTDTTTNVTVGTHTHSGGSVPAPDPGT